MCMAGLLAAARRASGIPVRPRAVQQDDTLTGPMESRRRHAMGAQLRALRAREGLCARTRGAPLERWLLFLRAAAQPVF